MAKISKSIIGITLGILIVMVVGALLQRKTLRQLYSVIDFSSRLPCVIANDELNSLSRKAYVEASRETAVWVLNAQISRLNSLSVERCKDAESQKLFDVVRVVTLMRLSRTYSALGDSARASTELSLAQNIAVNSLHFTVDSATESKLLEFIDKRDSELRKNFEYNNSAQASETADAVSPLGG